MAGVSFAASPITPTGKNVIAPEEPAPASNAAFLADRQLYSTLSEIPCRRATRRTLPPAASTSASSAAFSPASISDAAQSVRVFLLPTMPLLLELQREAPAAE